MRNITMTGTIVLSPEDSAQIRKNILNPTTEYLQDKEAYFAKLASSMIIHSSNIGTTVEFDDLDLSNLDALIEKDNLSSIPIIPLKNSEYISNLVKVSFVGNQIRMESLLKTLASDLSFDISNTRYNCIKNDGKTEIQGCNLTDAA